MANPFAVDGHFCISIDTEMIDFWDTTDTLHVRRVATRAEYDSNFSARVNVARGNECSGCVINYCGQLDGHVLAHREGGII